MYYHLNSSDVVTIHDLGPITHPHLYAPGVGQVYKSIYQEISRARPHLIFVSEATRSQFIVNYGNAYNTEQVIFNPVRSASNIGLRTAPRGVQKPFFLTVGAVGDRKNQAGSVEAFARTNLHQRGFHYVICGGPEPGYERVVEAARCVPNVKLIGYVSDAELRWLYANAEAFVLASHLEGFGMPAAEAILRGLLPILSKDGALGEVAGPEAVYVDADDVASIARGLSAVAGMTELERSTRVARAQPRMAAFEEARIRADWGAFFERLFRAP